MTTPHEEAVIDEFIGFGEEAIGLMHVLKGQLSNLIEVKEKLIKDKAGTLSDDVTNAQRSLENMQTIKAKLDEGIEKTKELIKGADLKLKEMALKHQKT
jgi:hypothetical protein